MEEGRGKVIASTAREALLYLCVESTLKLPMAKKTPLNAVLIPLLMGIGMLWTCLIASLCIPMHLMSPRGAYKLRRVWAKGGLSLLGIHPHYTGLENLPKGGAVLAPNHGSVWDILVMCLVPMDFKFIAKRQLSRAPILGQTLTLMGTYWVDRKSSGRDISVMKEVEEGLKAEVPVLIFPEGTRTKTGDLLPFKKGAFRLALQTGKPLVPVAILGAFEISPPKEFPTRWGNEIYVRIGEPYTPASGMTPEAVSAEFRARLLALLK